jgi:hypothetical protein
MTEEATFSSEPWRQFLKEAAARVGDHPPAPGGRTPGAGAVPHRPRPRQDRPRHDASLRQCWLSSGSPDTRCSQPSSSSRLARISPGSTCEEREERTLVPVAVPATVEAQRPPGRERITGLRALMRAPPHLPAGHDAVIGLRHMPAADVLPLALDVLADRGCLPLRRAARARVHPGAHGSAPCGWPELVRAVPGARASTLTRSPRRRPPPRCGAGGVRCQPGGWNTGGACGVAQCRVHEQKEYYARDTDCGTRAAWTQRPHAALHTALALIPTRGEPWYQCVPSETRCPRAEGST